MAVPALEKTDAGFKINGAVTLATAPQLLGALPASSAAELLLDLSATEGSDSSLVALLLGWGRQSSATIRCQNTPDEVVSLINLYGLEDIILH